MEEPDGGQKRLTSSLGGPEAPKGKRGVAEPLSIDGPASVITDSRLSQPLPRIESDGYARARMTSATVPLPIAICRPSGFMMVIVLGGWSRGQGVV